jgi:hypothetical protein
VELTIENKQYRQQVGLRIENFYDNEINGRLTLTNQGIFVVHHNLRKGSARVSFPAGVRVVEGRDEFKKDDNYNRSVAGAFNALAEFISKQEHTTAFVESMGDFIPALASAFGLTEIKSVPHIEDICESFLHGKRYVLTRNQHAQYSPFFGNAIMDKTFIVSPESIQHWSELYRPSLALEAKVLKPTETMDLPDFYTLLEERKYANLNLLARELDKQNAFKSLFCPEATIAFVEIDPPIQSSVLLMDGRFTGKNRVLYINTRHPAVASPFHPGLCYSILADFLAQHGSLYIDYQKEPADGKRLEEQLHDALAYIRHRHQKRVYI